MPNKDDKSEERLVNNFVKLETAQNHSPTDRDSGMVDGSASENTPSSLGETLDSINNGDDKPAKILEIPEVTKVIKVEELENYVVERRESDNEGFRKEYEVTGECDIYVKVYGISQTINAKAHINCIILFCIPHLASDLPFDRGLITHSYNPPLPPPPSPDLRCTT